MDGRRSVRSCASRPPSGSSRASTNRVAASECCPSFSRIVRRFDRSRVQRIRVYHVFGEVGFAVSVGVRSRVAQVHVSEVAALPYIRKTIAVGITDGLEFDGAILRALVPIGAAILSSAGGRTEPLKTIDHSGHGVI